jgi:hypothetical protein
VGWKRALVGAAAAGLVAVLAGCGLQYYGYNAAAGNILNVNGGAGNEAQYVALAGGNAVRMGVYAGNFSQTAPCPNASTAQTINNMQAAAAAHVDVLLMVKWCDPGRDQSGQLNTQPLPPNSDAWVAAVKSVVDTAHSQGVNIIGLELWNEPNSPAMFGGYSGTIAGYEYATQIFEPIYANLHGYANLNGAPIITAGLNPLYPGGIYGGSTCDPQSNGYWCSGSFLSFVINRLANDGYHADGVGVHLYADASFGDAQEASMETEMEAEFNDAAGRTSKPLWVTEIGRKTDVASATTQGTLLVDMLHWLENSTNDRAIAAFAYDFTDVDNTRVVNGTNVVVPYGVLDGGNASGVVEPKGGDSGAYCRLAAEVSKTPPGC